MRVKLTKMNQIWDNNVSNFILIFSNDHSKISYKTSANNMSQFLPIVLPINDNPVICRYNSSSVIWFLFNNNSEHKTADFKLYSIAWLNLVFLSAFVLVSRIKTGLWSRPLRYNHSQFVRSLWKSWTDITPYLMS